MVIRDHLGPVGPVGAIRPIGPNRPWPKKSKNCCYCCQALVLLLICQPLRACGTVVRVDAYTQLCSAQLLALEPSSMASHGKWTRGGLSVSMLTTPAIDPKRESTVKYGMLRLLIKKTTSLFVFIFLRYGSWRPPDATKAMSDDVQTFSTRKPHSENFTLSTIFCPPPPPPPPSRTHLRAHGSKNLNTSQL